MPGNPLVRFDEGRVGRTRKVSPSLLLYRSSWLWVFMILSDSDKSRQHAPRLRADFTRTDSPSRTLAVSAASGAPARLVGCVGAGAGGISSLSRHTCQLATQK
jgi:hypothetical protein